MRDRLYTVIPILILLLLTFYLFGKTLIPASDEIIGAIGDIKHIYYPYREFLRYSLFEGKIPFWNPYLFSGMPFIAHPYTEFFYPTTLPFIFLPSNIYFSLVFALHIFIAALSMYFLMLKFTDKYAALFSAIIYAFSGYFASRIYAGHIDYVISSALWPIIFLKAYEYIHEKNRKALFWGSILLCLQIFTGLISITFFIFFTVIIFNLFISKKGVRYLLYTLKGTIIYFLFGFGLSAVFFLPSYEFISNTIRGEGLNYAATFYGSATTQTLLLFLFPEFLGSDVIPNSYFHGPPPDYVGHIYFIGITPLIIIAIGIFYSLYKRIVDKRILALLFITFLAILISLGPNSPFNFHFALWKALAIYRTIRLPVRHLIIAVFTLSIVSALFLTRIKSRLIKIILIGTVIVELIGFSKKFIFVSKLSPLIPIQDQTITKIRQDKELVRVLPDFTLNSPVLEKISFSSPLLYHYFSTSGYTPAILTSYYDFVDRVNGNKSRSITEFNSEIVPSFPYIPALSFLNVKYIIVDNTVDQLKDKKEEYILLEETPTYRIYQSRNYLPRFFFVTKSKIYYNHVDLLNNLQSDQYDFKNQVILLSKDIEQNNITSNCTENSNAKIDILKYDLNSISITIDAPCNGFLSTSETYFPGWIATIDRKSTKILKSNEGFRALPIPKGSHTVNFAYRPTIYYIGAVLSISSALLLIFLIKSRNRYIT